MENLTLIGIVAKDLVLKLAGVLVDESSPGFVVVGLVFLLVVTAIWMGISARREVDCIRWLRSKIGAVKDPKDFPSKVGAIDNEVIGVENRKGFLNIAHAWKEYRETLIPYDAGDGLVLRNSVRPSTFFNLEDLHIGPGFFKVIPGFFVSFGLFLTFLGLISALSTMGVQMNASDGQLSSAAMSTLLRVASAKFIMSLTGLFCSILFTLALRWRTGWVDAEVNQLNLMIERKLTFISLEAIGIDQLKAVREQKDHFKAIGLEMVAEFGRPLREELPLSISNSISGAIAPLIQNVNKASADGLGSLVQDLSSRFSTDVGRALEVASQKLVDAGSGIEGIVHRLNHSSGNMGSAMEGAIDRLGAGIESLKVAMTGGAKDTLDAFSKGSDALLSTMNSTLAEIAKNTGEGAKALNEASAAMSQSAVKICSELEGATKRGSAAAEESIKQASQNAGVVIQDAGKGILDAFAKASAEVGEVAKQLSNSSSEKLLAPLHQLGLSLKELVGSVAEATRHTQAASMGMQKGAEAADSAADTFRGSALVLERASKPIAISVQAVEDSTRSLESSTANIAESSRSSVQAVTKAIKAVADALSGEQAGIQATLKLLESCLERMRDQGDQIDQIDEKLGAAFEGYRNHVEDALGGLEHHVRKIQEEYTPALATLQTLVEQIEEFVPASRRTS